MGSPLRREDQSCTKHSRLCAPLCNDIELNLKEARGQEGWFTPAPVVWAAESGGGKPPFPTPSMLKVTNENGGADPSPSMLHRPSRIRDDPVWRFSFVS